jgi:hypothetical protein
MVTSLVVHKFSGFARQDNIFEDAHAIFAVVFFDSFSRHLEA